MQQQRKMLTLEITDFHSPKMYIIYDHTAILYIIKNFFIGHLKHFAFTIHLSGFFKRQ